MTQPLDGLRRRRIHLLRHAEAAYFDADGQPIADSRQAPLTPRGREQARAMGELLASVSFDRVICSGLPRTRETASLVCAGREFQLEVREGLEEIRSGDRSTIEPGRLVQELAYAMFNAHLPDARFHGGELFSDFYERVTGAFAAILDEPGWTDILLVCHGGTNRALLTWVLKAGLPCFASFEQDSCCLNVIDIDSDDSGRLVRTVLRASNVTTYDPGKAGLRLTTLETMARRFLQAQQALA